MVMVGRVEVLSPRDICSCPVLWDSPLCWGSVGLAAWAPPSRDGVKKCRRNSPQLAPHPVALQGRHETGGKVYRLGHCRRSVCRGCEQCVQSSRMISMIERLWKGF